MCYDKKCITATTVGAANVVVITIDATVGYTHTSTNGYKYAVASIKNTNNNKHTSQLFGTGCFTSHSQSIELIP